MNIHEISKPVTAKSLNESLAKKFGSKIKLENFTLEQLEDARNRIRTKLSQVETNESFDSVHTSESYQKSKLFLDVLNAAISEADKKPDADGDGVPDWADKKDGEDDNADKPKGKKPKKGEVPPQFKKKANESLKEKAVCKECGDEFGKATTDCKNDCNDPTLSCWVKESEYKKMNEGTLKEGAEDQAELVMASKDMVDRLTGWMEDTAEMQSESMLELADAIRDEMGSEKSEAFTAAVKPSLEALYTAMEQTRIALTGGVGMLTGEGDAPMMGDDAAMEPTVDMEDPMMDPEAPAEDDAFAAADAAMGGEEEAGREKRESVQRSKKKLAEVSEKARRLTSILSKKK